MAPILRVNNIEVVYSKNILVLKGLSLEVNKGKIISILGSNGAGKTTTLKAISGLLKAEDGEVTSGKIEFNGRYIQKNSPEEITRDGIFQVMEGRRIFQDLTVEENLKVATIALRDKRKIKQKMEMVFGYFPILKNRKGQIAGYLSGGEQQMLCIGRALMSSPTLMLLDEPSMGLSPLLVEEIFEIIKQINKMENISMILVEQNAIAALDLCEFGYVMENGRIILEGAKEKLKDNPDVKEFYLGLTAGGIRKSYRDVKHYKRRKRWLT